MNTEIAFREKRMTHEIVYSFGAILFYWQSATKRKLRQEKMEKKKKSIRCEYVYETQKRIVFSWFL